MRIISLLLLFALVLSSTTHAVAALSEQFRFSHLDINSGLSDNQVKCFLKDSRGFVWIGTSSGLNRYDGNKLKIFKYDSNDSTSISENNINKLFEGPGGKIWILTNTTGPSVYDPDTDTFYRSQSQFLKLYGLPANAIVTNILKDKDGNFWFISAGQGITKYNPSTRVSVNLKHQFSSKKNTLSTSHVSGITQNSKGDIWIIHRNGILEKLDRKTLKVVERNEEIFQRFSQKLLSYELSIDSDDDVWAYLPEDGGGVFYYNQQQKAVSHFHKNSITTTLNNNMARGVVERKKGEIWVGTDHGGINVIDKRDFTVKYILHNGEVEKSLAHNSIYTLYKDNEGIIWIGTFKKGANYFHDNIIRFAHLKHQNTVSSSLPFDDVNSFAEDEKGNLWIGTNGGGLLYLDRASGVYTRYRHDANDPNSLSSDIIVSLLIDKNKTLWIGTYLAGLNKFDGEKFTHFKHDPKNSTSISDNNIWELFEDSKGNIWIGTLHGGLELFDVKQQVFYHSKVDGGEFPIHCDYITSVIEDSRGNIWAAGGYGIDVFNKQTGKSTYFMHDPKNPGSLVSNHIMSIFRDSQNNIWIGSTEGLDLYDPQNNSFHHFSTDNGLPNNTIISILEDEQHNLWLSTPNGLSNLILNRKETDLSKMVVSFRNFDELDGLQGKAFNENAAFKLRNGELLFGGSNGVNIFHPSKIGKNEKAPKVVFTDFQLFNKSLVTGKELNGRVILPKAITRTGSITLKHYENVFSIEFAALNFLHPEKNKYRYKLDGFDKEWHTITDNNKRVTYTNLDAGDYEFRVQAANNDGVWNDTGSALRIAVLAPFWKTKEAFLIYIGLAFVLLVLFRKMELQRARAKFRLEQERSQARQMHELDLMKIRFFTNVSHEFRTPLSLILAPIEKLLKTTQDHEQVQQFQMINKNAKRLLNLVNQLLDFRKIEVEEIALYPSEGNVVKFVEETVRSFSDISDKKNISLSFKTSVKELQVSFDMDKMEKVLFNLLSNAFKFTPDNGSIAVALNCLDNDSSSAGLKILEIKVQDTGIGIAKENQKKVFDRFFKGAVPANMVSEGSGIGLAITKEFVKLHGGVITVDSTPGVGSCFTVTIPVKEMATSGIAAAPQLYNEMAEPAEEAPDEVAYIRPAAPVAGYKLPVVLLVEDNEDFRFYLKDNLKDYYCILEAKDGKEGWQKALAHLPDLIISDLMMPELNGIDLCKKIKHDARTLHIPFVLLTAHHAEEKKLKSLDIGANDYITKPFNFDMLLSRIRNLITQREQLQKVLEKKISVQSTQTEIVSLDDKLIQKAIKVVEDNLSDSDFSVEFMSRELAVSRVHLYKKLVALTGQSPVEFIRKIRLQHAAQLLEKSQLTVAEVAYKVGFNNRKYFTKYFKEEYQVLPSVYAESKAKESQV